MITRSFLFICLAVFLPAMALAESRSIGIEVTRSEDESVKVTIHSSVESEEKADITVADAAKILKEATGWGSGVLVAIVVDNVDLQDYFPLLQAVNENSWLFLELVRSKGNLGDLILKAYNIEPSASANEASPDG